jgi:hypothetical protein
MRKLKRGTQVIYKPDHCKTVEQMGCQPGFVTSGPDRRGNYFVRYWIVTQVKNHWTIIGDPELRTKASSELTSRHHLVVQDTVDNLWVEQALKEYC